MDLLLSSLPQRELITVYNDTKNTLDLLFFFFLTFCTFFGWIYLSDLDRRQNLNQRCKNKKKIIFSKYGLITVLNSIDDITCCTSTIKGVHIFVGRHTLTLSSEPHYLHQLYQCLRRGRGGWHVSRGYLRRKTYALF